MPDDTARLYDRDWYAWTQDQAARLRAWPEHLRPNGLDVEHLAEEVEDMGKSDRARGFASAEAPRYDLDAQVLDDDWYPSPAA